MGRGGEDCLQAIGYGVDTFLDFESYMAALEGAIKVVLPEASTPS
jgi:hypothetical protein